MARSTPIRHRVREHSRRGNPVRNHLRGAGTGVAPLVAPYTPAPFSRPEIPKPGKNPKDIHGRPLKKIGASISYLDGKKKVSGRVLGIRQEYYIVVRNGKAYKVDRRSAFTRIGGALAGRAAGVARAAPGVALGVAAKGGGLVKGAARRRIEEWKHWRRWEKEMKQEETMAHKRAITRQKFVSEEHKEKQKLTLKEMKHAEKIAERERKGPLWKRTLKGARGAIAGTAEEDARLTGAQGRLKKKREDSEDEDRQPDRHPLDDF